MARRWPSLKKAAEECSEGVVEMMKLLAFPDGKHPGRRRNVILSLEDELGDIIGAINYTIDKEKLDRRRIERRAGRKYKKFSSWWGVPQFLRKKPTKSKKR